MAHLMNHKKYAAQHNHNSTSLTSTIPNFTEQFTRYHAKSNEQSPTKAHYTPFTSTIPNFVEQFTRYIPGFLRAVAIFAQKC